RATFRVIVRPLVAWIWLGGILLIFGTLIAVSPSVRDLVSNTAREDRRTRAALYPATAAVFLLGLLGITRAHAQNDSSSSLHGGSVGIRNAEERRLFSRLLCQCGDCARLPLDTCGCGWAEKMRSELRQRLAHGDKVDAIMADYRAQYGAKSL